MNSIVIYFSQTGNTARVAKAIQSGIQSTTGQCDIVTLKEANLSDLPRYDLIGIGAPVFAFLEPGNVAIFIKRMKNLSGKHCFIFTTHGGHPGNILPSMAAKLDRAGLKVIGSFSCDGKYYLPHRFDPWYTDGHPDEIDLQQAKNFGKEMVGNSQRLARGEEVQLPKFKWLRGGIYHDVAVYRKTRRPLLSFDKEKCTYPECRLCVDNCPVGAIDLSADPIVFQGRGCIVCDWCEQICPNGALNFPEGYLPFMSQFFFDLVHRYEYPTWFKKAESELIENRGTLYRRVGREVDIEDPERAAYKVNPHRPRVTLSDI